jgi:hypothetical protein
LIQTWKDIPTSWLSCPPHGGLIFHPQNPSIALFPMKTAMPASFSATLGEHRWTVSDVHSHLSTTVEDISSFRLVAINVAPSNETVGAQAWEAVGVKYVRVPVKRNCPKSALDQFIETCNTEAAGGRVMFLVYSGKGLNRVSFCIAGSLSFVPRIGA